MRRAAGFVLFHGDGSARRFLVLRNARHQTWGVPKGHLHEGEGEIAGAIRETVEETGIADLAPVPGFRREIRYTLPGGKDKAVAYYLARTEQPAHRLSPEHDAGEWVDAAIARARLAFPDLQDVLDAAVARLDAPGALEIRRHPVACPVCCATEGTPWLTVRADYRRLATLCDSAAQTAESHPDTYVRCANCRTLRLAEVLDEDLWHAFTFAPVDPAKHAHDRPALEAAAAHDVGIVARHARPGRWLEIGSGYGYTLAAARARGIAAEGLDLAPAKLRHAREALAIPAEALHLGDPASADLPAAAYDAVLLVHVIEHLPDPVRVLRRIADWLAPAGVCYLATPNAASWRARLEGERWGYATPFGHLALYDLDTLAGLLHRAGLGIRTRLARVAVEGPVGRAGKRALAAAFPDALAELCVVADRRG